jgi:hypothetical protein
MIKKKIYEYAYVRMDKDDIQNECNKYEQELRDYIRDNFPAEYKKLNPEAEPVKEVQISLKEEITYIEDDLIDIDIKEDTEIDPDFKKDIRYIYRQIAAETHPDKIGSNKSTDLFSQASQAYSMESIGDLLYLALQVNIEIPKLSQQSLIFLNEEIDKLRSHISGLKNTFGWSWGRCTNKEEKQKLSQLYITQHLGDL